MGMSSVTSIINNYFKTLVNQRTGKTNRPAVFLQIVVPAIIGTLWLMFMPSFNDYSNAIVGISIVAALLCAMATLLFQVRIDLETKSNKEPFLTSKDIRLIDELFSAVLWAIMFGLIISIFMIIVEWSGLNEIAQLAQKIISGIIVMFIMHFVFVLGVIIKRLNRVYELVAKHER